MRGVKAKRLAPLVLIVILLNTCRLDLKVEKPYLELQVQAAYADPANILISYRFYAEEEVLRCRYVLLLGDQEIGAGETEPLSSGAWHEQRLNASQFGDGLYRFHLVVQAQRGGEFVDLAFLDKTAGFYVDCVPPASAPAYDHTDVTFTGFRVFLSHPEWAVCTGSPVEIRYTLDGSMPNQSAALYNRSSGILVPLSDFDERLLAVAYDSAGNQGAGVLDMSPIFFDGGAPVEPLLLLDDTQRYVGPQFITITHPEWTSPLGSPVFVYYTLDGSDPLLSGTRVQYDGTPVEISGTTEFATLRAASADEAGNMSSIVQKNYRFMRINYTVPTSWQQELKIIDLYGFGFVGIDTSDVIMKDANNNNIDLFFNTLDETHVRFVADMTIAAIGQATIIINIEDPVAITHSITFEITN